MSIGDLHIGAHEGQGVVPFPDDDDTQSGPLDQIKNGIKLWGDIGLTIGKSIDDQTATLDKWTRHMNALQKGTPVFHNEAKSGTVDAAGDPLVLSLGKPDEGTRWDVRGVRVGGLDFNVAAAGTAGLYVSAYTQQGTSPGMSMARDVALSLPNVAFYGSEQMTLLAREHLFIVVFGGTVGQTYIANVSATVTNVAVAGGKAVEIV